MFTFKIAAILMPICKIYISHISDYRIISLFSECSLRMYGSCLTRFAFKTSDVNIDIKFPSTVSGKFLCVHYLKEFSY